MLFIGEFESPATSPIPLAVLIRSVTVVILVVVFVAVIQPLLSFWADNKKLRKFPSPSVAAYTSLWRIYHNLRNRHYLAIDNAHKQLGSHVRIAPNHISILGPQAETDIYGHGANMLKDAWYDGGAGQYRHMADVRVKTEHQAKRKALAHVFAQKTIASLEPTMVDMVSVLVAQIDAHIAQGRKINMRRYMNYFTIDLFAELLYGHSLKCLERGDDIVDAETPEGKIYKVPFIQSLLDATVINTVLGELIMSLILIVKYSADERHRRDGSRASLADTKAVGVASI